MITWYEDNDNVLRVSGARNEVTKAVISTATVTANVVVKETGQAITGVTLPLTLTAVGGQRGTFAGVCPKEANISAGQTLTAQITFAGSGEGEDAYIEEDITVEARTE